MSARLDDYENYVDSHPARQRQLPKVGLDCTADLSKKILLGVNVFFLILGAVIIGIGAYSLNNETSSITSEGLIRGIITIGVIILLTAFFGCCGALRESRLLLSIYCVVLGCVIFAQVVIAIMLLVDRDKATTILRDGWNGAFEDTRCDLQNSLDCCGFEKLTPTSNATLPACGCQNAPVVLPPCLDQLKSEYEKKASLLGGFGLAIGILELLGILFALCLRQGLKDRQYKQELEDARAASRRNPAPAAK